MKKVNESICRVSVSVPRQLEENRQTFPLVFVQMSKRATNEGHVTRALANLVSSQTVTPSRDNMNKFRHV